MATEDITLSLGIQFQADRFKKAYEDTFKKMEKGAKRASQQGQGAIGGFLDKIADRFTKMPKLTRNAEKAIKDYNAQMKVGLQQYKKETSELIKKQKLLKEQLADFERLGDAATAADRDMIASSKAAVAEIKKKSEAAKEFYETAKKGATDLKDHVETMEFSFSGTEMIKAAEEAGKELAEPFSALLSKDLPGAAKSFSKLAGRGIGGLLKGVGGGVGKLGGAMSGKADKMKAGGGPMAAMAGPMKALGGFLGKMGPMIQTFAKIGPILGTLGSAVVGLIKIFIDADAMVKEWNKDMVQAGGTNQFFAGSMGNANVALGQAEDSLDKFRNAAYGTFTDFSAAADNLKWGISGDTHKEVLANLQAEGVKLTTLTEDYGQLVKQSGAYTNSVAAVTQAAVAWSRNMGVSLQEITGFQAEMMTELGMSLGSTTEAFRMMSRSATESGIASNKFFAMIRGVSADLSLYNTRMEDAVKLLKKLGTVMSPRNAQKFMQWSMNAVKGMGRIQKLQTTLLAGPGKVGKMVAADIADKSKSIAKEMEAAGAGNAAEIEKLLQSGKAEDKATVKKMISGIKDNSKKGALNEAVSQLSIQKKRAKKGTMGVAMAAGQMAPVRQAAMLDAAIRRFGEVGDIGAEMMAENLGVSTEQLEQMETFKDAMDDQRAVLMANAKTDDEKKKIANMTMDQVYDTLTDSEKTALEAKGNEETFNKKMGTNVQGIMDKLQVLIDWFMNSFYNVVLGIWESILSIPGLGDDTKKKEIALAKEAKNQKNSGITKALNEAGGDVWKFRGEMMKSGGQMDSVQKAIQAKPKDKEGHKKQIKMFDTMIAGAGGGGTLAAALQDATKGTKGGADIHKKLATDKMEQTLKAWKDQGAGEDTLKRERESMQAQIDADAKAGKGLTEGDVMELTKKLSGVKDTKGLSAATGITDPKVLRDTMGKLGWHMDPVTLAKSFPEMDKAAKEVLGTTEQVAAELPAAGATAATAGKPEAPSAQAKASATTSGGQAAMAAGGAPVPPPPGKVTAAAAPPPGTGGGAPAGPAAPVTAKDSAKQTEEQVEKQEAVIGNLAEIEKVLKNKGIKLNKSWMDNHMNKMIQDATLESLRTALYEYYVLDHTENWGPFFKEKNVTGADAMKAVGQWAKDTQTGGGDLKLKDHAVGGLVTGVNGGLATVQAAAGEGLASVGKGERIVPAGGGGGGGSMKVELSLKGDLAALIEAKAQEVVVKHEAASKLR